MRILAIAAAAAVLAGVAGAQAPQPIARRYVLAAVQRYLQHPLAAGAAAGVSYYAPLTTVAGDPELVIAGARPDLRRGGVDLECRATRDPGLPAFTIWLPQAAGWPTSAARSAQAAAPVLISPGHLAELDIHQGTMALVTQVRPLQPARRGERVRALSLATHAVVEVEAIGENQVQIADH